MIRPSFAKILFLSLLSLVVHAYSGPFYVDDAGNDTNPGTFGLPYRSIQKGVNSLATNITSATCFVFPGLYTNTVIRSNKNPGLMVIMALSNVLPPVIDGGGNRATGLTILNTSRVLVSGFRTRRFTANGFYIQGTSTNNMILNCSSSNNPSGFRIEGQKNIIEGCESRKSTYCGVLITGGGDRNVVRLCSIRSNNATEGGVRIDTSDCLENVISRNYILSNRKPTGDAGGINIYSKANIICSNIVAYNSPNGIQPNNAANDNRIYRNACFRNAASGIYVFNCTGTILFNNTSAFHPNNYGGLDFANGTSPLYVKNNVSVNNIFGFNASAIPTSIQFSYNCVTNNSSGHFVNLVPGSGFITNSPKFLSTNIYSPYFLVSRSDSRCVDLGTNVGLPYFNLPDMGWKESIPAVAPALISPASNAFSLTNRPLLVWSRASDSPAGVSNYFVEIASNPSFLGVLVTNRSADSLTTNWRLTSDLSDGIWYWRVRAFDRYRKAGEVSSVWYLRIDTTPPGTFNLISPVSNSVVGTATPELLWQRPSDLFMAFYVIFTNGAVAGTNKSPMDTNATAPFMSDGWHSWRILAYDQVENTNSSGVWTFRVDTASYPPPSPPVQVSPASNSATASTNPVFVWHPVAGPAISNYRILLSDDGFASIKYTITAGKAFTQYASPGLSEGTWSWKVQAMNGWFSWGTNSPAWSLHIASTLPNVPALIAPRNLCVTNTSTPLLSWKRGSSCPVGITNVIFSDEFDDGSLDGYDVALNCTITPGHLNGLFSAQLGSADASLSKYFPTTGYSNIRFSIVMEGYLADNNEYSRFYYTTNSGTSWVMLVDKENIFGPTTFGSNLPSGVSGKSGFGIRATTEAMDAGEYLYLDDIVIRGRKQIPDNPDIIAGYQVFIKGVVYDCATTNFTPPALYVGTNKWAVRARSITGAFSAWSLTNRLIFTNQLPFPPGLVSPANNGYSATNRPLFVWQRALSVNISNYRIQIASNLGFTLSLKSNWTTNSLTTNWRVMPALGDSLWFWRVRTRNKSGQLSGFSTMWSNRIDTIDPPRPVQVSPASNAVVSSTNRPLLVWRRIQDSGSGTTNYFVELSTNQSFSGMVLTNTVYSTNTRFTNALDTRARYWRVTVRDRAGNSSISLVWPFSISMSLSPLLYIVKSISNIASPISGPIPGSRITFKLWYSNASATAVSVAIYDRVNTSFVYLADSATNFSGTWTNQFSILDSPVNAYDSGSYTSLEPTATAVRWLRWKTPSLGIGAKGIMTYQVMIK